MAIVLLTGWMALSVVVPETALPAAQGCTGYVRGKVFGALDMELDWSGGKLDCEGMSRPDGRGLRLYFAWDPGDGERLVLVLGVDGNTHSLAGQEKAANVTFIDERNGHFYSSGGSGRCWTDIVRLATFPASGRGQQLQGRLYCAAALPALNDRSSLTLGDLHWQGQFEFDEH
ncbi:MAG: hypothetical protein FJ170_05905 [Gammaproteobacteria bacterium]|nr:hypothetical protein [Gammaproteobacteria bacterium]